MADGRTPRSMRRSVQRQVMDRRTFMRGVAAGGAAVSIGLPALEIMLDDSGTALAQGQTLPTRLGVFFWGGGVNHGSWVPAQTGRDFSLPESLSPFEGLREHVTLVTGYNHAGSSPGHIPARGIALSASHDMAVCTGDCVGTYRGQNMPEPSVDALAAEAFAGQAPYDWLGVGICRRGPYKSNSSWQRGGRAYNRHEPSPLAFYERLFSAGVTAPPADTALLDATTALRTSMLDAVGQDIGALQKRLGAGDRQRLEQHLEGLRSLERRLQTVASAPAQGCAAPDAPMQRDFGDGGTHEEKEAKAALMSELLATALACDMTRAFSYEFSATQSGAVYWELGINGEHHDDVTHGKAKTPEHTGIITFIMRHYAQFAEALRARTEGDATLLDRTLILGTSEHADGGSHNYTDHPYLLVGGGGGRIATGQHHRHPNPDNNIDAPKVLLTAIRGAGIELAELGQADSDGKRVATEAVGELLS